MTFFSKYTRKTTVERLAEALLYQHDAIDYWQAWQIIWGMNRPAPEIQREMPTLNWHNQAPYSYRKLYSR